MEKPKPESEGHPFWPTHVLNETMILYALVGILVTLAILFPFALQEKADPLSTPEGIKPAWYFLPTYQAIKYVPKSVGIVGVGLAWIVLILWPFIDEALYRRRGSRQPGTAIGAAALILIAGLGILGKVSRTDVCVLGAKIHFDILGVPHALGREAQPSPPR